MKVMKNWGRWVARAVVSMQATVKIGCVGEDDEDEHHHGLALDEEARSSRPAPGRGFISSKQTPLKISPQDEDIR